MYINIRNNFFKKINFFLLEYIKMLRLTKYELGLIAKNRGINNHQNMSREKLLSSIDKLEHITENLSKYGLNKIVKMQNLSLNELEQIERMNNLSLNELKQIMQTRNIKNYKDMSKEDLLIALLKSNKSHTELRSKSEDNNEEIQETKMIFNELRNNFSKEEIKEARKSFSDEKVFDEYLEGLKQKDSLTEKEKRSRKRYTKKVQMAEEYIKRLKEDLSKFGRHQYTDNEDLEYKGI